MTDSSEKIRILAVDDEEFNLDIITDHLKRAGYDVIGAEDGEKAWETLERIKDIDIIVLDRMMPKMDGMQLLRKIKADDRFKHINIIMQTAAAANSQVLEGIEAGVFYYITKPYSKELLLSIVRSAADEVIKKRTLIGELKKSRNVMGLMEESKFRFKTIPEAQNLAYFIANCFPDPERVVFGLCEMLINAVEHGNLGITYTEKMKLLGEGKLKEEIEKRLNSEDYGYKSATLHFISNGKEYKITIKDEGKGFDWVSYLEMDPKRATDPNGRGIAMSRVLSFDKVEYVGCGNEVVCTINN